MISFLYPLDSQNSFLCFFNCYLHTSCQMVKRVCDDDFHAKYSIRIHLMVDPAVINTCHVPSELLVYMQLKDNGVSFFCISCNAYSILLINAFFSQCEIHELLALVYYDSLQNVVPFYDQRSVVPLRDAAWTMFCENSMRHFKKAFGHKYIFPSLFISVAVLH